jgi:twinkle protein
MTPSYTKNFRYISAVKLEALHKDCKDANDIARAVPPEALDAAIKKVCNECFEKHVPPYVIQPSSLIKSLVRVRDNTYANRIAINETALDSVMSLVPGHAGIVTGIPGHGKSTFLSWYAYKRASIYGHKTVFWSPENDPVLLSSDILGMTAGRLIQGHAGVAPMTDAEIEHYLKFVDEHFRVVEDSEEGSDIDTILNQMLGAAMTMGKADLFVIDPLNMIKMPDTKNILEAQKIVYSKISRFSRENNCFTALVAHPKKMDERDAPRKTDDDASESHGEEGAKKYRMPGMYSVSGSADFANMADLGLTVYRDDNKTTIMNWKARRPFLGSLGASADLVFQPTSGRFRSIGSQAMAGYTDPADTLAAPF